MIVTSTNHSVKCNCFWLNKCFLRENCYYRAFVANRSNDKANSNLGLTYKDRHSQVFC